MRIPAWAGAMLAAAFVLGAGGGPEADAPPLKVLLVTGGAAHDYETQKKLLTEAVSARANVEWTIVHEGGKATKHMVELYRKPDWAKGFDVVVHNECFAAVDDKEFVEGIAKAHADGVPAVVIHGSLHSYRSADKVTDAWRKVLGVTSVRHEKGGVALEVKVRKPDHPIVKGLPETWTVAKGELYVIEKEWPDCVPLATCYGVGTKKDQTTVWTNTCGTARVFGTSLGHANGTFEMPVYQDLVTRGLLWACDKLGDDGKPKPGYGPKGK